MVDGLWRWRERTKAKITPKGVTCATGGDGADNHRLETQQEKGSRQEFTLGLVECGGHASRGRRPKGNSFLWHRRPVASHVALAVKNMPTI